MKRAILLFVLLFTAPLFAADRWWDHYKKATAAAQANDWTTTASEMQKSIALKPAEELSARARNEILVYVPHFWMGLAAFKKGDVDRALSEFDVSESQGVIQKTQYWADLRAWRSRAQTEKAKRAAAPASESRRKAESSLNAALGAQMSAMSTGADRLDSYRAAQRKLQDAWEQFNRAGSDVKAYQAAGSTADQAKQMFAQAGQEALARKARAAEQKRVPTPQVTQTAAPPPVVVPPVGTPVVVDELRVESEDLADARVAVQSLKRRAIEARRPAGADPAAAATLNEALTFVSAAEKQLTNAPDDVARKIADSADERSDAIAALVDSLRRRGTLLAVPSSEQVPAPKPSTPGTSNGLRAAYLAFARGDLDGSERILAGILSSDSRDSRGWLLRGCTRYTKGVTTRDDALLDDARSDFRRALDLDPRLSIDSRTFSPKLVDFFNRVKTSGR